MTRRRTLRDFVVFVCIALMVVGVFLTGEAAYVAALAVIAVNIHMTPGGER